MNPQVFVVFLAGHNLQELSQFWSSPGTYLVRSGPYYYNWQFLTLCPPWRTVLAPSRQTRGAAQPEPVLAPDQILFDCESHLHRPP